MGDESVVHAADVAVVNEIEIRAVEKVIVELLPSVFNEGDGDVAEGR